MKVYLVECNNDNGERWEDHEQWTNIIAACSTKEKAKEYIMEIKLNDGWLEREINTEEEWYYENAVRFTYKPPRNEYVDSQEAWYTIREMEVL